MEFSEYIKTFFNLLNIEYNEGNFRNTDDNETYVCTKYEPEIDKDTGNIWTINETYETKYRIIRIKRGCLSSDTERYIIIEVIFPLTGTITCCQERIINNYPIFRFLSVKTSSKEYEVSICSNPHINTITSTYVRWHEHNGPYKDNCHSINSSISTLTDKLPFSKTNRKRIVKELTTENYKELVEDAIRNLFTEDESIRKTCLFMIEPFANTFEHLYNKVRENPQFYLDELEKKAKKARKKEEIETIEHDREILQKYLADLNAKKKIKA